MRLPILREHGRPADVVKVALLIALASLFATLIVPGIIAYQGGVFYEADLVKKLSPEIRSRLTAHGAEKAALEAQIKQIETRLDPSAKDFDSRNIEGLLKAKADIRNRLDTMKAPVAAIGFYLNPQMLLWPAICAALGLLVTVFRPPGHRWKGQRRFIVLLTILVYVLYEWPLWLRNFVLSSQGRVVYAYPNADIHVWSFIGQEGQVACFCFLIATLWAQWLAAYERTRDELTRAPANPIAATLDMGRISALADEFIAWQVNSVLLALGFLFFTQFFWSLVGQLKDQRYLISAILAHTLWGVCWVLLSLPLFARWRAWSTARLQAMALVAGKKAAEKDDPAKLWDLLHELQPLSAIGLSISGVAAAVSFAWPVVKALF